MKNTDVRKKLKEVQQDMLKTYYFVPNKRLFLHVFGKISLKNSFLNLLCAQNNQCYWLCCYGCNRFETNGLFAGSSSNLWVCS